VTALPEIKAGHEAPHFKLQGVGGNEYVLSEFRGKKNVVLLFYVLDWTPG